MPCVATRYSRIGVGHRNVARIRGVLWEAGILPITVTITIAILTTVTTTITVATALAISTTAITATISVTSAITTAVSFTTSRLPAGAAAIIATAIASRLRLGRISVSANPTRGRIAEARSALRIQSAGIHAAVVTGIHRASSGATLPAEFLRPCLAFGAFGKFTTDSERIAPVEFQDDLDSCSVLLRCIRNEATWPYPTCASGGD